MGHWGPVARASRRSPVSRAACICSGEGRIRGVIDGEVVAQFPAPGQQQAVRRTLGWQRREVIQCQACAAAVECAGSDLPPEY